MSKTKELIGCLTSFMRGLFFLTKNLIIFLIVVLFIVSFVKFRGCFSSEVIAYSIKCKEKPVGNYCENPEYTLTPTHYKVDKKNQIVLYWVEGFPIEKLSDCAVKDKYNWTCKYDDGSAMFGFNNGTYFEYSLQESIFEDMNHCHVSRHKYIEAYCKDEQDDLWRYGCMFLANLFL